MKSRHNFYWINGSKNTRIIFIELVHYVKMEDMILHLMFTWKLHNHILGNRIYFEGSIQQVVLQQKDEETHGT